MDNQEKKQAITRELPAIEFLRTSGASGRYVPPPPRGYVEVLAREFNASTRAVSLALSGQSMTRQAILIRNRFMEKYIDPYLNAEKE